MTDAQGTSYVKAALELHGFVLDAVHAEAVARQFARIEAIAGAFLGMEFAPSDEPAPTFRL